MATGDSAGKLRENNFNIRYRMTVSDLGILGLWQTTSK